MWYVGASSRYVPVATIQLKDLVKILSIFIIIMTSCSETKDNQKYSRQNSPSRDNTLSQSLVVTHPEPSGNNVELEVSIPLDDQQQDLPSSDSGHVFPLVDTDGGKSRKRPRSARAQSPEPEGQCLGTARHDEVDILTSKSPIGGRGIRDSRDLGQKYHKEATNLIADTVDFGKCDASISGSNLGKKGDLRLDNQGDVLKNGKRFANLQVQSNKSTLAASLVETEQEFGPKRIRRALNESLKTQKVQKLTRNKT